MISSLLSLTSTMYLLSSQYINQSLFDFMLDFLLFLFPSPHGGFVDCYINEVSNYHIHIAAMEAHLCEFSSLHLDKRCLCQLGQTPCNFCFTNSSGAFEKKVKPRSDTSSN